MEHSSNWPVRSHFSELAFSSHGLSQLDLEPSFLEISLESYFPIWCCCYKSCITRENTHTHGTFFLRETVSWRQNELFVFWWTSCFCCFLVWEEISLLVFPLASPTHKVLLQSPTCATGSGHLILWTQQIPQWPTSLCSWEKLPLSYCSSTSLFMGELTSS